MSQDSCKRDHESGILETNSFTHLLFSDDRQQESLGWLQLCQLMITQSIQEDAHHRLSKEEQRALDLATEEEQETARTIVSRLHVELCHSSGNDRFSSKKTRTQTHHCSCQKVQVQCV